MFLSRRPRPPLDTAIDAIWVVESEPVPYRLERVLPTGAAQMIVNLKEDQTRRYDPLRGLRLESTPGAILAGPHSRFSVIDTREQEWVAGVAFKPGGTIPFMRTPALVTAGLDVDLRDLWPPDVAGTLRERLLEAPDAAARLDLLETTMLERWRGTPTHPAVRLALDALAARPQLTTIASVTGAVGLSAKRFIERFKAEVGLTPKRFCRVQRFQRALGLARAGEPVDWSTVALDCGCYDQPHLIHEFRDFAGLTPTEYLTSRTAFQNHVKYFQDGA